MTTKIKIIIAVVIILGLLAGVAALKGWYADLPKLTKQWLTAPEMKTATKIKKVKVPVKEIVTIEKKEVSKKLKLPEAIAKDDKMQVIATAQIPSYEGETSAVAVMNTATGEAEIIVKQQPLSLFGLTNKKAIGLRYGYSSRASTDMAAEIYGRWDVLRIGSVHVGLYGGVTSTGDGKAMLNMEYRW